MDNLNKIFDLSNFIEANDTSLLPKNRRIYAHLIAKMPGIVSGVQFIQKFIQKKLPKVTLNIIRDDGTPVSKGDVILYLDGELRDIQTYISNIKRYLEYVMSIATNCARYSYEIVDTNTLVLAYQDSLFGMKDVEYEAYLDGGGCYFQDGLEIINENYLDNYQELNELVEKYKIKKELSTIAVSIVSEEGFYQALNSNCDLIIVPLTLENKFQRFISLVIDRKLIALTGKLTAANALKYARMGFDYLYLEHSVMVTKPYELLLRIKVIK